MYMYMHNIPHVYCTADGLEIASTGNMNTIAEDEDAFTGMRTGRQLCSLHV